MARKNKSWFIRIYVEIKPSIYSESDIEYTNFNAPHTVGFYILLFWETIFGCTCTVFLISLEIL